MEKEITATTFAYEEIDPETRISQAAGGPHWRAYPAHGHRHLGKRP
jgi:hypothetical protein